MPLWSFQGARRRFPAKRESRAGARSLKTQQYEIRRVRRCSRRARNWTAEAIDSRVAHRSKSSGIPRKEVIQPQLPLRLPCYDFTPITGPTFDGSLLAVRPPASGVARFRGVTGGVYKARERIHRGIADPRLLATPPSWRRVSASNPNRGALSGIRSTSRYCCPLYAPM